MPTPPLGKWASRFSIVVAVLALASPLVSAQTQVTVAGQITETIAIPAGEWRVYVATLGSSDPFRINLEVIMGNTVDVYAMDAAGYEQYRSPVSTSFRYYSAASEENTTELSKTFDPASAGTYYFVVDNAPISLSGAPGIGDITVQVTAEVQAFPLWFVGLLVVLPVAAIVAVFVVVRWRKRRHKTAGSPVTGPMPPPGPPPQPPFGPP